jgi:hypothetical protein
VPTDTQCFAPVAESNQPLLSPSVFSETQQPSMAQGASQVPQSFPVSCDIQQSVSANDISQMSQSSNMSLSTQIPDHIDGISQLLPAPSSMCVDVQQSGLSEATSASSQAVSMTQGLLNYSYPLL